jgi:hypothetical protein
VGWRNVAYGNIYYAENRSGISASMSLVSRGWGHVYFQKKKMKKELIKGIFVDQRKVKCYSEQDEWRATVEPPFFMQVVRDGSKKDYARGSVFAIFCLSKMPIYAAILMACLFQLFIIIFN